MSQLKSSAGEPKKDLARKANDPPCGMAVENVYGDNAGRLAFVEKRLRRADQPPVPGLITLDLP